LSGGGRLLTLVVGPQHPGSGHMRLFVRLDGDVIVEVTPDPGFVHRGVEKLAENRPYWAVVPLVEKASIMDSPNITLPVVHVLERLLGLEPPPRARYIRVLASELTRIRTHLYDLGLLGVFLGHTTAFMWCFAMGDYIAEVEAQLFGARTTILAFIPGGVRRDVTSEGLAKVERLLAKLERKLRELEAIFLKNPVTRARLEGVGVLRREDAERLGLVGPFARASGIDYDTRRDRPYEAYPELDFDVVVEKAGDAMARTLVRWREVGESMRIIRQVIKGMPSGDILDEVIASDVQQYRRPGSASGAMYFYAKTEIPPGEASATVEAARGLTYAHGWAVGGYRLYRLRFVTPSWRNLYAMVRAMEGHRLADMPAIYMSFGYFPPEADR